MVNHRINATPKSTTSSSVRWIVPHPPTSGEDRSSVWASHPAVTDTAREADRPIYQLAFARYWGASGEGTAKPDSISRDLGLSYRTVFVKGRTVGGEG
jgi:hypothetical protein